MKFVRLLHNRTESPPIEYGYVLKIESELQLAIYHLQRFNHIWSDALVNILKSKDYTKMIDASIPSEGRHITNEIAQAMHQYVLIHADGKKSIYNLSDELYKQVYDTQLSILQEGYVIYIMQSSGYFMAKPNDPEFIESDEILSADCKIWPDNKTDQVRYIQWKDGIHWYAKIGTADVVDKFGNQKWNTKTEAKMAVEEYLKEL